MSEVKPKKNKGGRPTKREATNRKISKTMCKLDDKAIAKLEQVFSLDASIAEICFFLDITPQTLRNWRKKKPKLFANLERQRERMVLKARETIGSAIGDKKNPQHAFKYVEKKRRKEFGTALDGALDSDEAQIIGIVINKPSDKKK